jgi:hypothetical protein
MLKNDEKFSTAFKLILLSLMLAVQSLSFAHELDSAQLDAGRAKPFVCARTVSSPGNRRRVLFDLLGAVWQ